MEQELAALKNQVERLTADVAALKEKTAEPASDLIARISAHLEKYGDVAPHAKPTTPAS